MFDTDGKIWVVAAVLAIILAGLYIFLFMMEKRLKKLEKQADELLSEQTETKNE